MTVNEIVLSKLQLSTITPNIQMAIDEIGVKIHNYCNIPITEELPTELNFTYANMVINLVNLPNNQNKITSIKMGETSYSFKENVNIDGLIFDYKKDLQAYRRIKK